MLKTKLLLIFTFFSFLFITPCNAQKSGVSKKIYLIDSLLYSYRGKKAIPIIDSLIQNAPLTKLELLKIKVLKAEGLIQTEEYKNALLLSNKLLNHKLLKDDLFTKLHIERALLFEITSDLEKCEKSLDLVANYYQKYPTKKDELYGEYLYRTSSLKRFKGNQDVALKYAEEAELYGRKNNYSNVEATALMLISGLKYANNISENIKCTRRALYLYKKDKNYAHMSTMYYSMAHFEITHKKYNKAHKYLDSAIYTSGIAQAFIFPDLHKLKAKLYEKNGDYKNALISYKNYKKVSDSVVVEKQTIEVSEIKAKFNYEKESLKNGVLEQNLTNEREQKNILLIGIIILAVLLSSLLFLALNLVKKRKEIKNKNVILTAALDKNKLLLKELNHRVNNNLALILSLVKFQYYEIDNPKYKDKFQSLEHRIKTIAAAHEQLLYSKENIEGEDYDVQEYLSKITNALIDISTKHVQLNLDVNNINLNIDTMLPIGILINELMSNSLKHAVYKDALIIDIEINLQQSNIFIIYKDSGTVFKEKKNSKSLGVSIINSMIKQLKGTIQRKNSEYTITLQLKNSEK